MSQSLAIGVLIGFAVVAANLPFISRRLFAVIALSQPKTAWIQLIELLFFYGLAGAIGLALENQAGQIASQRWEFYAITVALFMTFSFPGFVYCYLFKHRD